jgi:hypothetical protein
MKRGKGLHIWILYAFALGTVYVNRAASLHWENVGVFAPGSALLRGVKFAGGTFVAWGDNHLVYSQDGVNWRRGQDLAPNTQFQSLAYGNGRFVAVGRSGYVTTSKDGAHWNTQFISTPSGFSDVAFGGGLFVAVGAGGLIATSPDGAAWTLQSGTTKDLQMVAYGNGRFVANARSADRSSDGFVVSTDGIHWTDVPRSPLYTSSTCQTPRCPTATLLGGLIFFQGKFVLLAYTAQSAGGYNSFLRSDDGVTWTTGEQTTAPIVEVESPYSRIPINSLSEANGMLVPQNVAFGNGLFVKVDYDVWSGIDPYQMTRPPRPPGPITSLAGNGKVVVAVGTLDHLPYSVTPPILILLSTNNGESFEQITPPAGAGGLAAVRYADGKFVAVGFSGTIITSPDGRSWTKVQSNTDADLYDLVYADGKWRAVGTRGRVLTSTDATSFTAQSLGDAFDLHSIAYGNGAYVVVSPHNGLFRSGTGSDWSPTGTNLFGGPWAVTFGDGKFVTSGFACATSTDGVNWEFSEYGGASGLRIAYANGFFASPRDYAEVEVSRDAKRWEVMQVDANTFFYAVDAVDGRLWTAGYVGAIWRAIANPQLTASINASGSYELNIDVDQPATFRILISTTGLPGSWQPADLLDISSHAKWTSAPSSADIQFFQVRKEYR